MILSVRYNEVSGLYDSLVGQVEVHNIGDSRLVANIMNAVWDGCEVGRSI